MTARTEILKLLKANANSLTENIAEFLIRTVEDLVAVGVDEREIADALIRIGLAHFISLDGVAAATTEMRIRADVIEKCGAQFSKPQVLN